MDKEKTGEPKISEIYEDLTGVSLEWAVKIVDEQIGTAEMQEHFKTSLRYYFAGASIDQIKSQIQIKRGAP